MRTSKIISIVLVISVLLSVTAVLQGCKEKVVEPAVEIPVVEAPAVTEPAEHPTEHPEADKAAPEHPDHPK